jgi:hypothetical protein
MENFTDVIPRASGMLFCHVLNIERIHLSAENRQEPAIQ